MACRASSFILFVIRKQSSCKNGNHHSVRFSSHAASDDVGCPVSSYNEWDPLLEIIVGRAEGQRVPFLHPDLQVNGLQLTLCTERVVDSWNCLSALCVNSCTVNTFKKSVSVELEPETVY